MSTPTDRAAYERAVLPHVAELRGVARRLTRSASDADDLVQEAMARAWRFWSYFEAGSNARAWLHRILRNTFVSSYRRKRREREITGRIALELEPCTCASTFDGLGDEVTAALAGLAPEFRDAVLAVDLGSLSYRDAADRLGCPIGTVMSRLHRGRRALRDSLASYAAAQGLPAAA
jgi:RNA polymerase sigma-70 factor (ECF subfamily)